MKQAKVIEKLLVNAGKEKFLTDLFKLRVASEVKNFLKGSSVSEEKLCDIVEYVYYSIQFTQDNFPIESEREWITWYLEDHIGSPTRLFSIITNVTTFEKPVFSCVISAAHKIKFVGGESIVIQCVRHGDDILHSNLNSNINLYRNREVEDETQGFVTIEGFFIGRKLAYALASLRNQIINQLACPNNTLYSEGLY